MDEQPRPEQPPQPRPARRQAACDNTGTSPGWSWLGRFQVALLRPETLLLFLALAWTIGAKFAVVRRQAPDAVLTELVRASWSDVLFFSLVGGVFAAACLAPPKRFVARAALVVSALVLGWSILNAAWLIATGVQLQPGVLMVLAREPGDFVPVVATHLKQKLVYAIPIVATTVLGGAWLVWKLIRPAPLRSPRETLLRSVPAAAALIVAASALLTLDRGGPVAHWREVLGFSSHWYALVNLAGGASETADVAGSQRTLPRAGERAVVRAQGSERPNVIVVMLESVSAAVTSLGAAGHDTTPNLEALAARGVTFTSTRVPCPSTTKAFWATLTGSFPDVEHDYAEAILVDRPYESLPSILGRAGYRSAFFQMAKGAFECGPGFFWNLGFDLAWFRENLEDPSSYLGYMAGDDFRMLDPMFDWAEAGPEPFLLGLITSVAHDPYELPEWWDRATPDATNGRSHETRFRRHLEAVRFTDAFLGELVSRLEQRGLSDRTLLVVIGDHGDGFRRESPRARWIPFEEVIAVPWVIHWPGHLEAGRRVDWPCSQLDVTPTVLSLLGFGIDDAGFDGADALRPQPAQRRFPFTTPYEDSPYGWIEGERKLVYWPYTDRLYLYDLAADPQERQPLRIQGPEKDATVAELARWRDAHRFEIPARRFRQRLLYDHWRAFSAGRAAWAYYVP